MFSYGLIHFAIPVIGFWMALTLVLSHFLKGQRQKWPLSMGYAAVVIGIVALAEMLVLGPHNMP